MVLKRVQFRLYPTKSQQVLIERDFSLTRKVYNFFLEYSTEQYALNGVSVVQFDYENIYILVVTTCRVTFDIERHLFFFKCSHKTIAFYFNLWYTNFVNGMKGVFDVREKKNNRARTFQLSPATLNDLDEYAATSLYSKSAIVEMALRKFFDDMKQKNTLTVESK